MSETFDIKKSTLWKGLILIILVIAGFALNLGSINGSAISNVAGADVVVPSGDVQVVYMHVEGSSYIFEPSSVKLGSTIRIVADVSRMPGCSKGVVSSELGISKTFTSSDNALTFVPNKAGIFYFSCSMNMYKGTLTMLNSDGSKSDYVQKVKASSGSSCGMGGGCGCGSG